MLSETFQFHSGSSDHHFRVFRTPVYDEKSTATIKAPPSLNGKLESFFSGAHFLEGGSPKSFRTLADVKPPPTVRIVDTPPRVDTDHGIGFIAPDRQRRQHHRTGGLCGQRSPHTGGENIQTGPVPHHLYQRSGVSHRED